MPQTKEGAAKSAAKYYGLSVEEYLTKLETESYCNQCKQWKSKNLFCKDLSRSNGLHKKCNECKHVKNKKKPVGMTGKKHTEESKKKMSDVLKGSHKKNPRIGWHHSEETKKKISKSNKGKPRFSIRGSKNYNWKGGITPQRRLVRQTFEYKKWRNAVLERDNYICQNCGDVSGDNLQAHHLKGFAAYPELRLVVDNGLTVCEKCHCEIHDVAYSTRKKIRKKKQIIGIRGLYQLSQKGINYFERIQQIVNEKPEIEGNPLVECACGCGKQFNYYDSSGRSRIFVSGHNFSKSPTMESIYKVLKNGSLHINQIIELTQKSKASIKTCLCKMRKKGIVEWVKMIDKDHSSC